MELLEYNFEAAVTLWKLFYQNNLPEKVYLGFKNPIGLQFFGETLSELGYTSVDNVNWTLR